MYLNITDINNVKTKNKKITLMGTFSSTTKTEPSLGITIMSSRRDVTPVGGGRIRVKASAVIQVSSGGTKAGRVLSERASAAGTRRHHGGGHRAVKNTWKPALASNPRIQHTNLNLSRHAPHRGPAHSPGGGVATRTARRMRMRLRNPVTSPTINLARVESQRHR